MTRLSSLVTVQLTTEVQRIRERWARWPWQQKQQRVQAAVRLVNGTFDMTDLPCERETLGHLREILGHLSRELLSTDRIRRPAA